MEPTLTTIAYFLFAGFAVGLAVGWSAALQRKDDDSDVINELKREVEAAQAAHRAYEQSVTSHFANTAQLLHRMQDDYRSIYAHIASGALLGAVRHRLPQEVEGEIVEFSHDIDQALRQGVQARAERRIDRAVHRPRS